VAAYELDKLLSLNMVPVTIERTYNNKTGSLQYWIENCIWESERLKKKMEPPDPLGKVRWAWQMYKVRVFDALIYNFDRTTTNLLVTTDWRSVMIDHSRAFKSVDYLQNPDDLEAFSRSLMDAMSKLDEAKVKKVCGEYLTRSEIETLLARRDRIIKLYRRLLKEKGGSVVYP